MPINSKIKGKTGELEFAKFLREQGFEARRTQQFCGVKGDGDLVTSMPIFWEIKRCQNLNLHQAMEKAEKECGLKLPIIAHRKNRTDWLLTLRAIDLKGIIKWQF